MRTRRWMTMLAAGLLGLATLSTAVPPGVASGQGAAARNTSGCFAESGVEVCFSSPPHVPSDPTVLRRASTLFDAAGPGDTIRVAMFRWDIKAPTDALLAAQRRGAVVLLVGDDDLRLNRHGRRLIKGLEEQDPARTNVTICKGACLPWRAPGPHPDSQDVQHLKFYLTDIGGVQSFITSSANLEDRQYRQYNSMLKIDDPGLYGFGLDYFARLEAQSTTVGGKRWHDRDKTWSTGPITATVYPNRRDLLLDTLKDLSCPKGSRVSAMFAVIQRDDVRRQLARLSKAGCKLRVITSRDTIENWIEKPQPTGDIRDKAVRTVLTHGKMLVAHAGYRGGKVTDLVVTGTSNTTCGGLLYNDEVMLRVVGNRWLHDQYLAHFDDAYARAFQGRSRIMPVMKPCRR